MKEKVLFAHGSEGSHSQLGHPLVCCLGVVSCGLCAEEGSHDSQGAERDGGNAAAGVVWPREAAMSCSWAPP